MVGSRNEPGKLAGRRMLALLLRRGERSRDEFALGLPVPAAVHWLSTTMWASRVTLTWGPGSLQVVTSMNLAV